MLASLPSSSLYDSLVPRGGGAGHRLAYSMACWPSVLVVGSSGLQATVVMYAWRMACTRGAARARAHMHTGYIARA